MLHLMFMNNYITLNNFHYLDGAFCNASPAACAFAVIHCRYTVNHFYALFRTVLDTEFALYTPGFAIFCHHCSVCIQVGAKGTRAL